MPTQTATKEKPKEATKPPVAESKGELVTLQAPRLPYHPAVKEHGFDEGQWKTLVEAVFPNAKTVDAVLLAIDYCKARKLDIFKRAVHIVPIWDSKKDNGPNRKPGGYVETVWPGVAEHRITAVRTGQYAGADPAQFGPVIEKVFEWDEETPQGPRHQQLMVRFPEWCQITIYKFVQGHRVPFPGPRVYWLETYARKGRSLLPNDMWQKRAFGQIEKCAEAGALRRAFPEEFGDEWTAEESGAIERAADHAVDVTPPAERPKRDPEAPKPEPFTLVNGDGQVFEFDQAAEAVAALSKLFAEASTLDALDGIWESNNLSAQLRDRGFTDLADAVQSVYADTAKALAPKPETTQEHQSEDRGNGADGPELASVYSFDTPIPVPTTEDGQASNWKAWGIDVVEALKAAATEDDLHSLIAANQSAFANCANNAPKAYKSLNDAIDKRRKQIKANLSQEDSNPLLGM